MKQPLGTMSIDISFAPEQRRPKTIGESRRPLVWKLFIPALFASVFNLTNYALASVGA